jgi:PKD repeat protein
LRQSTRVSGWAAIAQCALTWVALALGVPLAAAAQSTPLFSFAQISDSQPGSSADWARFELVLDTLAASGTPGALLPQPVDFVLFAGDLVSHASSATEWTQFRATIDARLTANGIPYRAVPGNHDQDNGGLGNYTALIGDPGVWDTDSAALVGHNGVSVVTGWSGLRIIGFNNSNGAWNQISAADLAVISARIAAAASAGENVFLLGHHPHSGQGVIPLATQLESPVVTGYARGHSGSPRAQRGLSGIANPDVWDLNSNAIVDDGVILYYEAFADHLDVYVIQMVSNPTALPAKKTIPLAFPLLPDNPPIPVVDFSAQPVLGPAPLAVQFGDLSTEAPSAWSWSFGDGASSSQRNPSHTYQQPGVYDVSLAASNGYGTGQLTKAEHVIALPPAGARNFAPSADARVASSNPTSNYGSDTALRVRTGSPTVFTYLRFDVTGIGAGPALGAKLRLFATDGSADGGTLYDVTGAWSESAITWSNAPPFGGAPIAAAGPVATNTWIELDVGGTVTGDGSYAFALSSASTDSAYYSSREGANPPQLRVQIEETALPAADFTATPTSGVAPLAVSFGDLSTGAPTAWQWRFGDGATSAAQHPVHVYSQPGVYDVKLTALNSVGSNTRQLSAYVNVTIPPPPTANFSATPTEGTPPLGVSFTDTTTGNPTAWLWDFGDGATSTERNPVHVYTAPGLYDVRLTASNAGGSNSRLRSAYVSVISGATFAPVADARVALGSPSSNYGGDSILRARGGSSAARSYLRFDASSLGAASVVDAQLRLFVTDPSSSGGSVHEVASSWSETGINWNNAPPIATPALSSLAAVSTGQWVLFDVTPAVRAGIVSFAIQSANTNSVYYASREGATPPRLVVETGPPIAPTASFSLTPASGPAPLTVAFSDRSTGATSWLWNFGDGATSTLRNPTHSYAAAGSYDVSLGVSNEAGSDAVTQAAAVSVAPPLPIASFAPVADGKVSSSSPNTLYGTTPDLRLRFDATSDWRSFLRFDVAALPGPVARATLRLTVTDGSKDGGAVYAVPASFTEATLDYATAPALDGTPLVQLGAVATGQTVEIDVTSAVTGNGSYAFGLRNANSDSAYYSSREGASPPQLVIEWVQ